MYFFVVVLKITLYLTGMHVYLTKANRMCFVIRGKTNDFQTVCICIDKTSHQRENNAVAILDTYVLTKLEGCYVLFLDV